MRERSPGLSYDETYDVLEVVQILLSHGVGLGNNGDQVDPSSKPLHHLDVKGLDTDHQLCFAIQGAEAYVVPGLIK